MSYITGNVKQSVILAFTLKIDEIKVILYFGVENVFVLYSKHE
jgi:hypothetical protein